jgi:hypothetical protein
MKIQVGTAIVCAALLLTMFAPGSFGQSQDLRVQIPFDFYVGSRLLPAGTYQIKSTEQQAIFIYDGQGRVATALTHAHPKNVSNANNRLVFNQYGTVYFLSASYWQGYRGRELTPSTQELEIASKGTRPTPVALVPPK